MRQCYFCKEPPTVEIRGEHIFITPSHIDNVEIVITPNVLKRTVAVYNSILAQWQVAQLDKVAKFR